MHKVLRMSNNSIWNINYFSSLVYPYRVERTRYTTTNAYRFVRSFESIDSHRECRLANYVQRGFIATVHEMLETRNRRLVSSWPQTQTRVRQLETSENINNDFLKGIIWFITLHMVRAKKRRNCVLAADNKCGGLKCGKEKSIFVWVSFHSVVRQQTKVLPNGRKIREDNMWRPRSTWALSS